MAGSYAGGSKCCFATCKVKSSICRGVTFHALPKAGVNATQDAWRARLIYLTGRHDHDDEKKEVVPFNPDKAKVCSIHFTEDCFIYRGNQSKSNDNFRGRRLKFGAEPTLHLPKKFASIPDKKRKSPVERIGQVKDSMDAGEEMETGSSESSVGDRYGTVTNIQQEMQGRPLPPQWCVIMNTEQLMKFAVLNNCNIEREVTVQLDDSKRIQASVRVLGIQVPRLTTRFSYKTIHEFLLDLASMCLCSGVTDTDLQELAQISDRAHSRQYFRHITNNVCDNGDFTQQSCVRGRDCRMLINAANTLDICQCKTCCAAAKILRKRLERRNSKVMSSLHPNDPLHGLSGEQLKGEVKRLRAKNKKLRDFKTKLEEESVQLSPTLHNDLLSG